MSEEKKDTLYGLFNKLIDRFGTEKLISFLKPLTLKEQVGLPIDQFLKYSLLNQTKPLGEESLKSLLEIQKEIEQEKTKRLDLEENQKTERLKLVELEKTKRTKVEKEQERLTLTLQMEQERKQFRLKSEVAIKREILMKSRFSISNSKISKMKIDFLKKDLHD